MIIGVLFLKFTGNAGASNDEQGTGPEIVKAVDAEA